MDFGGLGIKHTICAAVVAATLGTGAAQAAIVTYDFTGRWGSGLPFSGQTFSGSFSYDLDAALLFEASSPFSSEETATYRGLALTIDVFDDGLSVFTMTPQVSISDVALVDSRTSNNDAFFVGTPSRRSLAEPIDPGLPALSALFPTMTTLNQLQLTFLSTRRLTFLDTTLIAPDPADFGFAELLLSFSNEDSLFNQSVGPITSIRLAAPEAEVPLPAGLPLLAAGLGALALLRRGRGKRDMSRA